MIPSILCTNCSATSLVLVRFACLFPKSVERLVTADCGIFDKVLSAPDMFLFVSVSLDDAVILLLKSVERLVTADCGIFDNVLFAPDMVLLVSVSLDDAVILLLKSVERLVTADCSCKFLSSHQKGSQYCPSKNPLYKITRLNSS